MQKFKEDWRTATITHLEATDGLTDIYEFGVFGGNSMIELDRIHDRCNVPIEKLVGFDSFDGIPKELAEPVQALWDPERSNYFKAFNARKLLGVATVPEAVASVRRFVELGMVSNSELVLVPGFYEDSLTDALPAELELGKAAFVDIDCDIYTSSIQALTWLFENGLVDTGTYVAYDDWGGTPGYQQGLDGESRAHREITERFGVDWEVVASYTDPARPWVPDSQIVFRLR
jgi:Macrocin-O-methyltransferase (TylF)